MSTEPTEEQCQAADNFCVTPNASRRYGRSVTRPALSLPRCVAKRPSSATSYELRAEVDHLRKRLEEKYTEASEAQGEFLSGLARSIVSAAEGPAHYAVSAHEEVRAALQKVIELRDGA